MRTPAEKGHLFRELHSKPGIILLPNPWDAGSAKLLASLGFEALATTSLGMSNALGRPDGEGSVSRAELLENCRVIAGATDLPVNADLENGYADDPKEAATILRDAAAVGISGGSLEDWSGERIYDFNHAVERVAAVWAAGSPATARIAASAANTGRPPLNHAKNRNIWPQPKGGVAGQQVRRRGDAPGRPAPGSGRRRSGAAARRGRSGIVRQTSGRR